MNAHDLIGIGRERGGDETVYASLVSIVSPYMNLGALNLTYNTGAA
jgi:hypothetical protein